MGKSRSRKKQIMNESSCTITDLRIKEYKLSCTRERDILWMKHRNLRKLFDEIDKTDESNN